MSTPSSPLYSSLRDVYLDPEIVGMDDRSFLVHVYRSVLGRAPEFDDAEPMADAGSRFEFLARVASSEEAQGTSGSSYREYLLRFARGLGRTAASDVVADQLQAVFPNAPSFLSGLPTLKDGLLGRTENALSLLSDDPSTRSKRAYDLLQENSGELGRALAQIQALQAEVDRLSARVLMLERKVF